MKGKKWLIGSLLVAATGILGACGGGSSAESDSDKEVTLTFGMGLLHLMVKYCKKSLMNLIKQMIKTSKLKWIS